MQLRKGTLFCQNVSSVDGRARATITNAIHPSVQIACASRHTEWQTSGPSEGHAARTEALLRTRRQRRGCAWSQHR